MAVVVSALVLLMHIAACSALANTCANGNGGYSNTVAMEADGVAVAGAVQAGKDVIYSIDLGTIKQALLVKVTTKAVADTLSVYMYPGACPPTDLSSYKVSPQYQEGQKQMWYDGVENTKQGFYEVGVHAPDLARSGKWFVRVVAKWNATAPGAMASESFTVKAVKGTAACRKPLAGELSECGPYVDYPSIFAKAFHRDTQPPRDHSGTDCRKAIRNAWCKQQFYQCGENGIGDRPCPLVCSGIQEYCPVTTSETEPAGWRDDNKAINDAVCKLYVTYNDTASGLHSNFGPASNCFPGFVNAGRQCQRIHYACDTPTCIPTARPLLCDPIEVNPFD
jgi:hypothetical protein